MKEPFEQARELGQHLLDVEEVDSLVVIPGELVEVSLIDLEKRTSIDTVLWKKGQDSGA